MLGHLAIKPADVMHKISQMSPDLHCLKNLRLLCDSKAFFWQQT